MSGTIVTLGVPDDPVFIPAEQGVSKIGGVPHWLCGEPENLSRCRCARCGHQMALMLSADCPIDDEFDRVVFVYVCPNCGGDAKAFRQKRVYVPSEQEAPAADNPLFGPDSITSKPKTTTSDLLAAFASFGQPPKQEPKGKQQKQKKPQKKKEVGKWPGYYLETFDEPEATLDPSVKYTISSSLDSNGPKMSGGEEEDKPDYAIDPALVEFNERIDRCPSQVLRYCRFGEPLIPAPHKFKVPKCSCGAERCFEMQLIPTVINFFDPASDMDFGSILIYTCSNDCGEGSFEEFCHVCPPL